MSLTIDVHIISMYVVNTLFQALQYEKSPLCNIACPRSQDVGIAACRDSENFISRVSHIFLNDYTETLLFFKFHSLSETSITRGERV